MAYVRIWDQENLEKALKVFDSRCRKERIMNELKRHKYYIKPSVLKRLRKKEEERRRRRKQRIQEKYGEW